MPYQRIVGTQSDGKSKRKVLVDFLGRLITNGTRTEKIRPWGEGLLTSNGVQYGTIVTSSGATETDVIVIRVGEKEGYKGKLVRLELNLTWAVDVSGTPTDDGITLLYVKQKSTDAWTAIMAADTQSTPSAYTDVSFSGLYPMDTVIHRLPFHMKLTGYSSGATDNCYVKPKSSSYITVEFSPE